MSVQTFRQELLEAVASACRTLGADIEASQINLSPVPETAFGDIAMVCFPLRGKVTALPANVQNNPAAIAQELAKVLADLPWFDEVRAQGPYVNMSYDTARLSKLVLSEILDKDSAFGDLESKKQRVMIEFSGPNTNKPQHLGHLRNNVIGESMSRILKKAGYEVVKVNIINDRGIHICKSMSAYIHDGADKTPESVGKKGDHLIGDYYVMFEKAFQAEYGAWLDSNEGKSAFESWKQEPDGIKAQKALDAYAAQPEGKKKGKAPADLFSAFKAGYKDKYFNTVSKLGQEAAAMLVKWEDGDAETRKLWALLNGWVIDGFMDTYKTLGIRFDKLYYESETYKLGKDLVAEGLKSGLFHQLPDGAVAFDLAQMGLSGDKIVLRSNGTSVYITQDIGCAIERHKDYHYDRMVYVVADEQNHHFKVLFAILGLLRPELKGCFEHLSYGMVTLPNGRMKSREGTVVDTDCLIEEMTELVKGVMDDKSNREHYADADEAELMRRAQTIALAAVKYFLLDVTPASWMEFNPEKSLDLQGRTGAYCLMNYARTRSILRKAGYVRNDSADLSCLSSAQEKRLLMHLMEFHSTLNWAAESRDPAKIAEYLFNLCKCFAFIFTDKVGHPILTCDNPAVKAARLALVDAIGVVLKAGLELLGIETLEEM